MCKSLPPAWTFSLCLGRQSQLETRDRRKFMNCLKPTFSVTAVLYDRMPMAGGPDKFCTNGLTFPTGLTVPLTGEVKRTGSMDDGLGSPFFHLSSKVQTNAAGGAGEDAHLAGSHAGALHAPDAC